MKKTIILNETMFNRLTYLLEKEDKNITDARDRFKMYSNLGNDYFKNPNLSDDVKTNDSATYNQALKDERGESVEGIYGV